MASGSLSRFLQHPLNAALFRWYPPLISRSYMRLLGRLYFSRFPVQRDLYVEPMRKTLRSSAKRHRDPDRMEKDMLQGVFDHYFEKLLTAYWGFYRMRKHLLSRVKLVHQDVLDEALRGGRGVILTTAHFGAVEFLPASLAFRDYPVTMAVRYQTPQLKRTLESLADRCGLDLLDTEGGAVVPQALAALRQKRIFIFELDEIQSWRPAEHKVMTLFDRKVRLDRTIEILQRRTGAPVLMGLMERVRGGRYQLIIEPPSEHHPAPTGLGPDAQLLKRLEHYIYDYPDHWYIWKEMAHLEPLTL
jgi:lauroyl/myristoyl acyltransferase